MPRTGMLEVKAEDQGHNAQVFLKKGLRPKAPQIFGEIQAFSNIKSFHKVYARSLASSKTKNKNAHDLGPFSTNQIIVLSSSWRRGIFEDMQAFRPRLQTVSSRTSSRPRTSLKTPPLITSRFPFFNLFDSLPSLIPLGNEHKIFALKDIAGVRKKIELKSKKIEKYFKKDLSLTTIH